MKSEFKVDHTQDALSDALGVNHDHVMKFIESMWPATPSQTFEAIHLTDKLSPYEKLYAAGFTLLNSRAFDEEE